MHDLFYYPFSTVVFKHILVMYILIFTINRILNCFASEQYSNKICMRIALLRTWDKKKINTITISQQMIIMLSKSSFTITIVTIQVKWLNTQRFSKRSVKRKCKIESFKKFIDKLQYTILHLSYSKHFFFFKGTFAPFADFF